MTPASARFFSHAWLATATVLCGAAASAAPPVYRVEIIGTIGNRWCTTTDINVRGQAIGSCEYFEQFFYAPGKGMRQLMPPPGYHRIQAAAINNHGQVAGRLCVDNFDSNCKPFVWDEWGGFHTFDNPPGYHSSWVRGINDRAQVVGVSYFKVADDPFGLYGDAFVGTVSQGSMPLRPKTRRFTYAHAINNQGVILGRAGDYTEEFEAWGTIDRRNVVTPIEVLPMDPGVNRFSVGSDINDHGQVVGSMRLSLTTGHAYIWTAKDGFTDIDGVDGYWSSASSINNREQVVGLRRPSDQLYTYSFYWEKETGIVDLLSLIDPNDPLRGRLSIQPSKISDRGQIVGFARTEDGPKAVILTPVE